MTCEECHDLIVEYAVGTLGPAELEAVRAHLASGCPSCAVELAEVEATLATLPLALEPIAASAGVREQLMTRVAKSAAKPASTSVAPASMHISQTPPRGRWFRYAAAACVGAVLAALAFQLANRDISRRRAEELADVTRERDATIARLETALADRNTTLAQLRQLVDSPGLGLVSFQSTEAHREASGRILWDREKNQWHINVFNMKSPAPGQAYELWFFGSDPKPVAGPILRVDANGNGKLVVDVPQNIGPIKLAAFTNEPEQGLPAPSGQIHLKGEISP